MIIQRTDGENSRTAKLNWRQVDAIRSAYLLKPANMTQLEWCRRNCRRYRVGWSCIRGVVTGQTWRRIPDT